VAHVAKPATNDSDQWTGMPVPTIIGPGCCMSHGRCSAGHPCKMLM
jgi:hypothetical protein